jgi:hypothetical protein
MRAAAAFIAAGALGIGIAWAGDITEDWAGHYERSFENGLVSGETYTSTDVLDIVRIDAQSAYVEASLQFYNGHECYFSGVFQAEGESLVYREREPPPDYREQCILTFTRTDGEMRLEDANGSCRQETCGARGGYSGTTLPIASQRPMTDEERASMGMFDVLRAPDAQ